MKLNLICAAGLVLLLAGCGGKGAGLNAAGGNVTQAQAVSFFTTPAITTALGSLVPTGNPNLPIQNLPTSFVDDFASCTTKNPSPTEDHDNDGIPATLQVKYNCPSVMSGGATYTRVGNYQITDLNDEAGNANKGWGGGFRYQFDFNNKMDASHEMFEDIYSGFFEVKTTSSSVTYNSEYTGTVVGEDKKDSSNNWNWKWQSNWKNAYSPEDMSEPYKKGSALFDGFIGIKGSLGKVQGHLVKLEVAFKLKSSDLTYDRSCSNYWKTGSIFYIDGSNNEIRYEYACSTYKVFYNGKDVTNEIGNY